MKCDAVINKYAEGIAPRQTRMGGRPRLEVRKGCLGVE
jgi:hypothetical protein